jgi:peptidylprolyl isomerase
VLLLAGCTPESATPDDASPVPALEPTDVPSVTIPADQQPPDATVTEDLTLGTGTQAAAGDTVRLDFVAVAWSTGEIVDETYGRAPFETVLDDSVVPGFRDGVVGMRVGGRRRVVVPPADGYGDRAFGRVPGNATLVFVVDLLEVVDA